MNGDEEGGLTLLGELPTLLERDECVVIARHGHAIATARPELVSKCECKSEDGVLLDNAVTGRT